ncbi:MAG: enoyl-CoA hydratase/isomerase family protein [Elusimicrobia bacterium]|nr:enoyl-CoA hydratase/isomerase family protein [Elusimicrobiota bacterium]
MTETATYKTIETSREEGLFTLTLNRPQLNILNMAMLGEISLAVKEAQASGCGLLVLRAKGKAFSAGADVGEHLPDKVQPMLASFHGAIKDLYSFKGISIACVHGSALGGGCELALAADLVLASAVAAFGQPEIKLGVIPPVAMVLLPVLCHARAAREIVLSGESVGAEDAKRLGLANQVFAAEEFEAKTQEYVGRFKAMSRSSLALAKKTMRRLHPVDFNDKLAAAEDAYLKELLATHDGTEGCKAFLEKRKPAWKHS